MLDPYTRFLYFPHTVTALFAGTSRSRSHNCSCTTRTNLCTATPYAPALPEVWRDVPQTPIRSCARTHF